jgi:hypothetical protein
MAEEKQSDMQILYDALVQWKAQLIKEQIPDLPPEYQWTVAMALDVGIQRGRIDAIDSVLETMWRVTFKNPDLDMHDLGEYLKWMDEA